VPPAGGTFSQQAKGGKDQLQSGCTEDSVCADPNRCNGIRKCNLDTNTCYSEEGSLPDCNDGNLCTIDTCKSDNYDGTNLSSMCVHTPKPCEDGNKCNGEYVCDAATGSCVIDVAPVDCDDGMACTIDTCNTSTGQCHHNLRTCNDGNDCTLNDRCDNSTGCVFQNAEPNCCGNAQCEDGEEDTCALDCSDEISTSVDTSVARYRYLGSVFNLQAKSKNVTIAGVGVHCILPESIPGKVHVYAKNNADYYGNGNWYKKSAWTKVVETTVTCAGQGQATQVNFPVGFQMGKYEQAAFSIYVLTDDIMNDYPTTRHIYDRGGRYNVYKEDSYLQIQTGSGNFRANGWGAIITPMAYSGAFNYVVVDDLPTTSPTLSFMPTPPPPTSTPTNAPPPTMSPTTSPSNAPSGSPTSSPSESMAPTEFVPEVVELTKNPSGWANILRAVYFEVKGDTEWAKITDLKIVTYRTRGLSVYMKRGEAVSFENSPCSWQLIAETNPGWYGSYWRRVYPQWKNGFTPVVIEPHEVVSFYVVNTGNSYGILGKRTGNRHNYYKGSWGQLSATSAVGAVTMGDGRCGERDKPFKPCSSYYSAYGMYGGLKMETMRPGATSAPTPAPTEAFSPDLITSDITGSTDDIRQFNGVQFGVYNAGDKEVIVNSFNVHFAEAGTKHIEVWYRPGDHASDGGSCHNYNNWCGKWTKLVGKDVDSAGFGAFTATPKFVATVPVSATTSFAIVTPDSELSSHITSSAEAAISDGKRRTPLSKEGLFLPTDNIAQICISLFPLCYRPSPDQACHSHR